MPAEGVLTGWSTPAPTPSAAGGGDSCSGELILEVHERDPRARPANARLGFVETGATSPFPLEPIGLEVEMVLRWGDRTGG